MIRSRSRGPLPLAVAFAAALVLAGALPGRAAAQSVLAARGLGVPIDAVDARGRALASVGVGLFGTVVTPTDPNGAVDLPVPTVVLSLQTSWLDVEQGGEVGSFAGNRFPAIGVSYPVRDWGVLTLTYAAVLDQRWSHEQLDTLELAGQPSLPILDRFSSDGGVSAVRLGFAHRVSPSLAVGAAAGVFTGSSTRLFTRVFDTLVADVNIAPFQSSGRWSYSGATATLGALVDLGTVLRGAAALTWSGTLEADPTGSTEGGTRRYDMPLELRGALSGALAPELSVVLSAGWADWSGIDEDLTEGSSVGSALTLGAGAEWTGSTIFGRELPIRVGWRRADLPFQQNGASIRESAIAGGLGVLLLARSDGLPLARVDLGVERGSRTGGTITEDFWRSTLSLRVAGF